MHADNNVFGKASLQSVAVRLSTTIPHIFFWSGWLGLVYYLISQ